MARYIDADLLYSKMTEEYKKHYAGSGKGYDFTIAMQMVQNQPTAYDVEAVVAELEEMKCHESGCLGVSCGKCKYNESCLEGEEAFRVALDNAIEVVRKGGKE